MDFRDKNLLILTNSYPDEADRHCGGIFVKEQVRYLARHFNEVYVVSPQPWGTNRELHDYKQDNVEVYYPRFFHVPVGFSRKRLGDNFFRAVLRVIKHKGLRFDLIHAHFTWPSGYAGVKLAGKFGVPSFITIHENRDWFMRELNSGDDRIYWAWRNATALIRVNKVDVPPLNRFNQNVFNIPNGFTPDRLPFIEREEARNHLEIPEKAKVLFSLGNLIERKGFRYLVDAMSLVVKNRGELVCYIGGKGPLRDKLQERINKLGLQKHVKLLGFVPDEELKYWMNAADLFVLPSLSESFGLVVLEALAVGTPVVATYNGGSEEVITSKDYGLLCPPRDPECLAEKILIALAKDWDREKLRKYAEQFSWENVVKKILEVYDYFLEGSK